MDSKNKYREGNTPWKEDLGEHLKDYINKLSHERKKFYEDAEELEDDGPEPTDRR